MRSVYLAGASAEWRRARHNAGKLESAGVTLATRWFETAEAWTGRDAELTQAEQLSHAHRLLDELRSASVLWLLCPPTLAGGAMIEFGMALALDIPTVVTGQHASRCLFTSIADYRDVDDGMGFVEVLRLLRR